MSIPSLLVETMLRGTALIAATYGLSLLLRRVPAATLHWLWLLALAAALVLPGWLLVGPSWSMPILAQPEREDGSASAPSGQYYSLETDPARQFPQADGPSYSAAEEQAVASPEAAPEQPRSDTGPAVAHPQELPDNAQANRPQTPVILWLVGTALCLGYWLREQISILLLARRGTRLTAPEWAGAVQAVAATLDLKRQVTLIVSNRVAVPMTWGFWRPVVLLPADAPAWTPQRRQVVLAHELTHVKRGDTLTQWIGLLSCAVNWFNPFTWWALHRLSVECERACDDRVLSLGIPGVEYASHLVDMARTMLRLPYGIKALSRKSELSLRVRSILAPYRNRRSLSWRRGLTVLLSYLSLVTLPLSTITPGLILPRPSKQAETTLLLAVPFFAEVAGFDPDVLREFEASHPGIRVLTNPVEATWAQPFTDDYYEQIEQYASAGDVIFVHTPQFQPAATLPGYFLDLTPLASIDPDLNAEDFFPAAWQSFQWDGGLWALPTYWDFAVMTYAPAAFDAAGLSYPSPDWTLDDLANAARLLTTEDTYRMEIVTWLRDFPLLRSLLGESLIDTATIPNTPRFDNPRLAALLEQWNQFQQEIPIGPDMSSAGGALMNPDAPMYITGISSLEAGSSRQVIPLPGGSASVVEVGGVAISAGTQHPEAAYELARFLSIRAEAYQIYGSMAPARLSLFRSEANRLPAELLPALEELAATATPFSETRYAGYIAHAVGQISRDDLAQAVRQTYDQGGDMADALARLAEMAIADQETALARRGTFTLAIPVPIPIEIPAGKIALRFGLLQTFIQPLPNREHWDRIMAEFVASDPDVGYIDFTVSSKPADYIAEFDCFYLPSTVTAFETTRLLSLDPLMSSDPAFDPEDFPPGLLDRVRVNGQTFGYPLSIQPQVLAYDAAGFERAGVPLPENGWSTGDFVATLEALKTATGETGLSTNYGVAEHLFILIQAFGGLPIDVRTFPPTADFTSPQSVEAARSVLDLVRQGYIGYRSSRSPDDVLNVSDSPLMTTAFRDPILGNIFTDSDWKLVSYPTGAVYAPVSIGVGAAYISQQAANPEACYRWISTIAENPDLLNSMPARTSSLSDPRLRAAQGNSAIEVYQQIDTLLRTPGTLVSRTAFGGEDTEAHYLKYWLSEAFDAYILDDTPLEDALAAAQIKADAYLGCAAQLQLDPSQSSDAYYQAHQECAKRADPAYPY